METGAVGGASSVMFQQVAAMQAPEKNAAAMQQEMQQVQKQTDQNRIESAKASGSSLGTNVNTYAGGFFLQKGCLETDTFLFLLKLAKANISANIIKYYKLTKKVMERQQTKRKKAFTLVELIVVITILGILVTIGFMGFKNFIKDARDGNRIMTIKNIENGLKLNYIKSNKYLEPEGEVIHGEINGKKLIKVGEFGKENARQININNVIVDPLTKQYYKYGTDARNKYYEIASVLEGEIAYKSILTKTYASSEYKAKVTGNYPGYIKFNSGSELWIANIPSIILNNTGSVELLGTEAYYVVDKGENLPYKINNEIIQKIQSNELIKKITKSQNAILTGVNITGITETNFEEYFSGTILESFNVNKVDVGNIQILKESVKQIVLGSSTTQYNSCATPPNYTDAIFTIGTPNKQNQEWQSISEETGCYWTCGVGKVLLGNECVSENCSGETPDGTIKVVNATQLLGGTWHYSETDGVCTYKCGENYTENGGNCEPSTRTNQTCTGLIANAVWNSASQITQTWSGSLSEWTPTLTGSYNETTSTTDCIYKCSEGFVYDTDTSTCKSDRQYSLMFDSASNQYLSRTPTTAGNRKTWTWSGWVKLGNIATNHTFFAARTGVGGSYTVLSIKSDGTFRIEDNTELGYPFLKTNTLFRDPSAWYHIIVSVDMTQDDSTDRVKVWVNGKLQTYASYNVPAKNTDLSINNNSLTHLIGQQAGGSYVNGYMSEVNFVDGQALTPTAFGETNSTTGQWGPKKYTGNYGTNGFYLDFVDGADLGKDKAGSNNWVLNGGMTQANNQVLDHPTNNFATLNPLSVILNGGGLVNQNLRLYGLFGGSSAFADSTIAINKNLYYFEVYAESNAGYGQSFLGIRDISSGNSYGKWVGNGADYTSYGVYGVALNFSTGKGWIKLPSNSWVTGDPVTDTIPTFTFPVGIYLLPTAITSRTSGSNHAGYAKWNFGQGGQSGLTYYPSAGGYFKYTPPTGFKALSTKNLPEPTIKKPNEHFDVVTYTGDGNTTKSINTLNFQPDLVWIKNRDAASDYSIHDSVRGATKRLRSNQTLAENTEAMQSFEGNGFTVLGAGGVSNVLNNKYVAWNWKAGGAAVTNTGGTITSQVSANQTAGFSIITWIGNSIAGATIGHGLNSTPKFFMTKSRNSGTASDHWTIYHESMDISSSQNYAMHLNLTNAKNAAVDYWNNTTPTSTLITHGYNSAYINVLGRNYVTYAFAEIPGYSKFGSYTGNGNLDGPFVYTGFRPKYVMIKRTDSTGPWIVYDTKRDEYNKSYKEILLNSSTNENNITENISGSHDILSNGFKVRSASTDTNYAYENFSGGTYIYAAFAEAPFKYANAR